MQFTTTAGAAMTSISVHVRRHAGPAEWPGVMVRWTGAALVAASWASAAIFGAYILAFYGGAVPAGAMGDWNRTLPKLYEPRSPMATAAIGLHFAAGAVLLLLGPLQLVGALRRRWPALHRRLGRVYGYSALAAGVGGLTYVLTKGTVGGAPMDAGFGLYGALTVLAAVQTVRHARARRFDPHRAWGIRLVALAVGSWLYRMDYGFWSVITDGAGHTHGFDGPFDVVMAFFFYLPNLAVAELFVRARRAPAGAGFRVLASLVMGGATGVLVLGTYYFTRFYWGPGIVGRVVGS